MIRLFARIALLLVGLSTAGVCFARDANLDYEKALQAYAEGELEDSYIHLKNALQEDPNLLSARLLLAEVYFNAGDIASAQKESEEALLLGADINLVLPIYGQSLVLQEKVDELFELERVSDSFTPASEFEWTLLKGQGYLLRGESELARAEFEKAATILPESVRSNNTIAAIYMSRNMDEDARKLVEKSLVMDPKNAKTWQLSGELEFKAGNYDQALEFFLRGNQLDPQDLRIQRSLAQVYLQLGERAKAQEYLDMILEASPDDPAATLISAQLLIGDGDVELGKSMLGNLSSMLSQFDDGQRQTDETMLFIRASAEYIQGNDQSAIGLFNTYLLRNKGNIAAIRLLADLYLRNDDIRRATELLSSQVSEVSEDLGLSVQLLTLYIRSGNVYRAEELLALLKKKGAGDNPYVVMAEAQVLRLKGQSADALHLLDSHAFAEQEPQGYGLLRGVLQLELGKNADAQRSVEQLVAAYPNTVRINNFAAATYLALDKLSDANTYIEKVLQLDPGNVDARFNQAMLYKKRGDLEESNKILKALVEERPSHTRALLLMSRNLFLQGKYDEAIEWSEKVYAYDKTSTTPAELQIEIYSQAGNWDKAREVSQRLVRGDPLNTDYLVQLANIAMKVEDQELAQNTLSRLYPLWKRDPEKLRQLADMQARFHNGVAARKSLEQALKLNKDDYLVQLDLARLDLAEGRYDTAQTLAQALENEFGQRSDSSQLLGEIAFARQQPEQARQYFLTAFKLDNDNTEAIARLYDLSTQGIGQKAFTDTMESTLQESSLPVLAVRLMADSYLNQGDTAKAAVYYEKLLDLDDLALDPAILNNLANIYAKDDLDKALATAMKALDVSGEKNYGLLDTVGWILAQQGKHEQALSYLRKSYVKNSTDPEVRYHLGATLLALGRSAEAKKELRAALDSGQQFLGREDAERLLVAAEQEH
ncbi:MAG: PEP-CTERM system TPR-repeat protein PrsT [Halioglobus sp.]